LGNYVRDFEDSVKIAEEYKIKSEEIIELLLSLSKTFEEPIKFLRVFESMGGLLFLSIKISKETNQTIETILRNKKYFNLICKTYKGIEKFSDKDIKKKCRKFFELLNTYHLEIEVLKRKIEIEKFKFLVWEFVFAFYIPCYWLYIFYKLHIFSRLEIYSPKLEEVKEFIKFYFNSRKVIDRFISLFGKENVEEQELLLIMIPLWERYPELRNNKIEFFSAVLYNYIRKCPPEIRRKIVEARIRKEIPILDPLRQAIITKAPHPSVSRGEIIDDRILLLSMCTVCHSFGEDISKKRNEELRRIFQKVKSSSF